MCSLCQDSPAAMAEASLIVNDPRYSARPTMVSSTPADSSSRRSRISSSVETPPDAVIGIAHGSEARAYPIMVMGNHELGNDTIDGIPIAITW